MNRSIRLRNAREAGLVLPTSGYEMSNEEMIYVDGSALVVLGLFGVGGLFVGLSFAVSHDLQLEGMGEQIRHVPWLHFQVTLEVLLIFSAVLARFLSRETRL